MNYIQYMKPGSKFWALPNGKEDISWSEFWSNWKEAIAKAKEQIVDNWENLKQDYKDAADPIAASERRQAESIEDTRAKQASMKFVSDNRTDYEKKRDRKNFELKEFEQKEQLNKDATDAVMWTLTGPVYAVQHLASPNGVVKTYGNTKAAVQNGGGPYLEKAVASAAGDVLDASILAAPLFTPEARLARAMNKNIKHSKPINPDKLPVEVATERIKRRDYVPYSTAGGDYFYHNSGLRGDVPRQYNKFHGAFASRSFGRNIDETFLSYGMPWTEHDAGIMYEFPGDILPDLQYMTDLYGKPTVGLVKPFGKSKFELSAIKTPNTPDYPFIDIRTGKIVDDKTALGDPLKLQATELNIGGNLTTIPTELMRQILLNTNYKVWRAPSKLYPFGAKELHLGNLTTTPDFHFDNPMYDYITGKPIYFYKSGGKLNYLNLMKNGNRE